jgi:hypothetical protein
MKETAPRTEDLALEWKNLLQRMKMTNNPFPWAIANFAAEHAV